MKLSEFLRSLGLFSIDIRQRIKNGQVKINGVAIKDDPFLPFDVEDKEEFNEKVLPAGDFIFNAIMNKDKKLVAAITIFGIDDVFGELNFKNKFDNFMTIRLSKKEIFVFEKNVI